MLTVAHRRQEIYDYFNSSAACQRYFFDPTREEEYVSYYNSMYLLQDSTESMLQHRARGFSSDPLAAYLEFWGIMQAVIIQQDSIAEIHNVAVGQTFNARTKGLRSWLEIRELRNTCAGHPANRTLPTSQPVTRSFMGRAFGGYTGLTYEQWQQGLGTSHPRVQLGSLLDDYGAEAVGELTAVLAAMKTRWP